MTGFAKQIIPLQREDHRLAFNVQSLDTLKYNPKNIRSRVAEAIAQVVNARPDNDSHFARKRGKKTAAKLASQFIELAGHQPYNRQSFITYGTEIIEHSNWHFSLGASTAQQTEAALEPIRKEVNHAEAFTARRLSMMRIMARRMKAATVEA